jgi:RNA polymerase sigma-70 factor (ECF subfamily)
MDEKLFNECVNLYADRVYRFVLKNLHHEEDSKDIVQSSFEKLWKNRHKVDPVKIKSFLFTIAYNQMIDHLRKSKRITLKDEFSEDTALSINQPSSHVRKVIDEALERLSPTQKSLVMLKDYEGYSYEEIGEITGLNPSQVKVYLHRARTQLRNYLVSPENIL